MLDCHKVALQALERVCGVGGIEPPAHQIIKHCEPMIAGSMRLSDDEDAKAENNNIALIAKRAFCVGYACGQNDAW